MGLKARVATLPGREITADEQQRFRVDDLLPSRVMRPADAQDAARELRLCDLAPGVGVAYPAGKLAGPGGPPATRAASSSPSTLPTGARATVGVTAEVTSRVQTRPQVEPALLAHFGMPGPATDPGTSLARQYLA